MSPNQHVIIFRDTGWNYSDSSNTLGLTTVTYDKTNGEIYDADMELNTQDYNLVATSPAPAGAYDLASVITHEAGHFLGLAHSADGSAVMYAHYRTGAASPTSDDIAGICDIYSTDGTRSTSAGALSADTCDPTPRHGYSSLCGSLLAPDAGAGGGGSGEQPGTTTGKKCSVGGAPGGPAGGAWGYSGLVVLGLLARRVRRSARKVRAMAVAGCLAIAAAAATALVEREARASVSVAVTFEDLVRKSTGVAHVTAVEQQAQWEEGRIVTYTHVRVDARLAGELPQEVWVRTLGGEVGTIGQVVEGEPSFVVGQASLVFLRGRAGGFEVTARAQGQFPIEGGDGKAPHLIASKDLGVIVPPSVKPSGGNTTGASRLARDVLAGRALEEASRDVVAAWARVHAP
jgi:hypothetical protein